jgi:hypothetical protein
MLFTRTRFQRTAQGIRFPVDDVTPAENALPMDALSKAFATRSGRAVVAMAECDRPVVAPPPVNNRRMHRALNGLIETVHLAFSQHRPLILSPDCIWLVIAQGFGHHINQNAEQLRGRMVSHEGRKTLTVRARTYGEAIDKFSAQIRECTDPVLHETLLCDFSTTTPVIRTASEVALMDIYQAYFEYVMRCICGIPEITLQGKCEDWQRIRARVEVLGTYDLEWWVSRLRPILDQFVRAADGKPDREFWRAIYKPMPTYGAKNVTGWIADLFPYLGDPPNRHRNPVLDTPRQDWSVPVKQGIRPAAFPSGFSQAPLRIIFPDETECQRDLMAGFFAVGQSELSNALFPVIGWSMVESDAVATNWEALARRFATAPKAPGTQAMMPGRPLELAHFAGRYAWMDLSLAKGNWRIVPSFRLKDADGKVWTCFAYDRDAIEQNQPGRVLALQYGRRPPIKRDLPLIQTVNVCDLLPGYDPSTWEPEKPLPTTNENLRAIFAKAKAEQVDKPEPQVIGSRLLEGDLFTFLDGLVEREGELG